jgi:hypothetical protein
MNFGYKQMPQLLLPFGKFFWIPASSTVTTAQAGV